MKKTSFSFISLFIICNIIVSAQLGQTNQPYGITKNNHGLEEVLNADGAIKSGVTGSFDPDSYQLEFSKDGKPLFKKSSPVNITSTATWSSLGTGRIGISNLDGSAGSVYAMAVNSEGDIYVGGNIGFVGDLFVNNIAKWDVSENKWKTLPCGTTNGVQGFVETIAINGNDVYVGGKFLRLGDGTQVNYIAKFSETTNTWSALVDDDGSFFGFYDEMRAGWGGVYDMGFLGNVLYVGGDFYRLGNGTTLARRAAKWDGTDWEPLSGGGIIGVGTSGFSSTDYVDALEVSGDKVYIGGRFSNLSNGTTPANSIAVWDETNDTWSSLTYNGINGISGHVLDIKVSGSTVFVGGYFSSLVDVSNHANNIAQWVEGSGWSALTSGLSYGLDDAVYSMFADGTDLYVSGEYTGLDIGTDPYNYIAKWNGSDWFEVSNRSGSISGVEGPGIYSLEKSGDKLYIGGDYVHLGDLSTTAYSFSHLNISTEEWSTYGSGNNGIDDAVRSVVINGGYVYVGGYFSSINAGVLSAKYVARWNYTIQEWSVISSPTTGIDISPACSVLTMVVGGNYLYVAGTFSSINGGTPVSNIARYNLLDGSWSALSDAGGNNGVSGVIFTLSVIGDDLYVGGNFITLSGGSPANYVAKWDESSDTWSAVTDGVVNGVSDRVLCSAVEGSRIYFGGYFSNIVCWNSGTNSWETLTDPDGDAPSRIRSLAVNGSDIYIGCDNGAANVMKWDDVNKWTSFTTDGPAASVYALQFWAGELYAGGYFTQTNPYQWGIFPDCLMKWNSTGGWQMLAVDGSTSTGVNHMIYDFAVNPAEGKMYVGGYFSLAGGKTAFSIASFTDSGNPLPVELNLFTASANNNKVTLNWATATEVSNYGFEVQRSKVRGEKSDAVSQDFQTLVFIKGAGNSNVTQNYEFTDENIPAGKYEYRLKQIDNDGTFKYSDILEINISIPENTTLLQNYPNPFNPSTNIEFQLNNRGLVIIKVFNILGKEVAVLINKEMEPGIHIINWRPDNEISSGVYFLELNFNNLMCTKKLLYLK